MLERSDNPKSMTRDEVMHLAGEIGCNISQSIFLKIQDIL